MHSGKDVPKGTLKAILRDTEITTESLIENL
jgi:predicted RNA binding protein YcfA (HicA-like mRNA interferase family)